MAQARPALVHRRVEAHERKRLEQLCRAITLPALADERVQLNDAGQVELKLKTPLRDSEAKVSYRRSASGKRALEGDSFRGNTVNRHISRAPQANVGFGTLSSPVCDSAVGWNRSLL